MIRYLCFEILSHLLISTYLDVNARESVEVNVSSLLLLNHLKDLIQAHVVHILSLLYILY